MAGEPQKGGGLATKLADLSLEQLMEVEVDTVVAASRHKQKLSEAPACVTIISAEDIRRHGYRSLADILRSVPGLYTTYDRNYHHLGIRGFNRPGDYDTRVLLLIDGHRVNDNIYDTPPIGTQGVIDVDMIERVEVIRGPGSALYGSNALLGVINVITKRGRDLRSGELAAETASFGSRKGRLTYGNTFGGRCDALFSASAYDSHGHRRLYYREYDDPATNNGVARNCDDDGYRNAFAKLSLGDFTLQAAYVTREKGIPTGAYDTVFSDRRTRSTDARGYLDLKYEREFSHSFRMTARLYYDCSAYDGAYAYDTDGGIVVSRERSRDHWWGTELVFAHTFHRHRLTWGAEYRDNFRQTMWGRNAGVYLDDRGRSRIWAVFAQDEFRILDNLTLVAGVRHDRYSTFGGTTNPRLALIWQPREGTALYGRAFRAPNSYEMYYHDGGATQKANPGLKPETMETWELVLEQRLSERLHLTTSAFTYRMKDLISQVVDPADGLMVYQNGSCAKANGFEVELAGNWPSGLRGRASYSFVQTEDSATGRRLVNSPAHLAKLNISVPIVPEKLFAGLELQAMSQRRTIAGQRAAAHCTANLTLYGHSLWKGGDISMGVYNIFGRRYGDPGSTEHRQDIIEQDGRTFRLQLTQRF